MYLLKYREWQYFKSLSIIPGVPFFLQSTYTEVGIINLMQGQMVWGLLLLFIEQSNRL
jgi:hypothetical protein